MWYLLSILGCMIIINIALLGYIPRINFPISKSYSFFIVVIVLILLVVIYEWRSKKNKLSSYFLSKINPHVEAIIFATCILSLSIGIFIMAFFNGDPNKVSNTFSGLSVIAFGVTFWTILTAFQEKNKENNTSHDDIEISEQNNNILNKNSHDEIEKLKQQNDDLTIQLKEKTDKLRDSHATSQKNLDNNLALSNQLFILKKEKKDLYKEIESLKQQNKDLIELLKESKQTYTYKKTRKNGEYKKQLKPRSKEE